MSLEHKSFDIELNLPYRLSYGPTWIRFLKGLQEKQIFGTKCPKCSRVLVPARTFCPQCFVNIDEWVEVAPEGKLVTWGMVNFAFHGQPRTPPYIPALIQLDGADVSIFHLVDGFEKDDLEAVKKMLALGRRVRAVWSDERKGHIFDISHFEPA